MFDHCDHSRDDQKERKSMNSLVKTSVKLLLRTKLLWFFLIITPVLSTIIFKLNTTYTAFSEGVKEISELENADEKVAYHGGYGEYVIKVYDASKSELSEYFLESLQNSGLFTVCRADISGENVTDDFIQDHIDFDSEEDRMGSALYIPMDFDERVAAGEFAEALRIYILSDDDRNEALESEIEFQFSRMKRVGATDTVKILKAEDEMIPTKSVTLVGGGNGRILTQRQADQKAQMGYAFSFLSLGFVFAGFFVASTAIKDQKNGVLTRINLTGTSTVKYFTSKFVTSFTVTVIMTVITGISSFMLNIDDIGMGRTKFIAMIFMMGLILNTLSMLTGILMGDVMGGAVAVFTIWCMSSLLSGLYFPLTHTSAVIKVLSFMMPQRWFLEGTEMIFVGDNKAFSMLICTTVAYLMVFISLGSLGLKMRRTESWGTN